MFNIFDYINYPYKKINLREDKLCYIICSYKVLAEFRKF